MNAIYFPVMLPSKNKNFRYWDDNPYFFYENILVTPFVSGMNFKRDYFGEADLNIYADSGGFQVVTRGIKISAKTVLRWQERVADLAFTLDIPPIRYKNYTRGQFLDCMKQSNKNADFMIKCKVNDGMELRGVIQGQTFEECKIWYDDFIQKNECSGYSIALSNPRPGICIPWTEQLRFASTIHKPFHFLGRSDPLFSVVLPKLAHKMNLCYTYDSSSPNTGTQYGLYIDPIKFKYKSFSKYKSKRDDIKSLSCSCPVCSKHTFKDMYEEPLLINLHNLYVKISFCRFANLAASDDELFKHLLNKIISRRKDRKNRDAIESQIMHLLYGDNCRETVISSYDDAKAIEKFNMKVGRTKELTDVDKAYLQQFIVKFIELKV